MTLRLRLSLAFLLVVAVPLAVAVIVVGRGVPQALDSAASNRLTASRAGAVALVDQTCTTARLAAEVLAREAASTTAQQAAADIVARKLASYAVVVDTTSKVTGQAGTLTGGAEPDPTDLGSCSRRQPGRAGLAAVADSVDVHSSANGKSLGAAAVAVPFDRTTATRISAAANASVTLLSGGSVIVSTLPAHTAEQIARAAPRLTRSGDKHVVGDLLVTAASLGPGEPVVVLSVPRAGRSGLEALLILVLLVAIVLAALIGWLLARVVTRPLSELSDAAARVAGGDLESRIAVRSGDEVGRLAATFNEMTDELREHIGELQSSRDELRRGLARLGDTLSSTHDLNRILSVILDTAIGTTRSAGGAVLVAKESRDELVLRAGRNLGDRLADGPLRVPVGSGIAGTVAATGEALRGGAADLPEPAPGEPHADQLISVPLRTGSGVLGVLNLYDRTDGEPFDDADLETIQSFAGQAAVAIDNVLLHQEAQRLSVTDGLTGLGNYRFFQQTVAREVDRAARFSRPLALLMLDLDRFKLVNDEHGHQVGDAVLVQVADRIRDEVREVDVVARYGGEEFVVVLPETGIEGACHLAERICASVRNRPLHTSSGDLGVTISIGVAVYPQNGDSPATLVRAADQAMYAAKASGRDRWRVAGT